MDQIIEHFQANAAVYAIALVAAVPLIIVFRRYTLPILQYSAETILYCAIMHFVFHYMVAVAKWFKEASSFSGEMADWRTPLVEFWIREEYRPEGLAYAELVMAAIIVYLVYRFRPLRFRSRRLDALEKKRQEELKEKRNRLGLSQSSTRGKRRR